MTRSAREALAALLLWIEAGREVPDPEMGGSTVVRALTDEEIAAEIRRRMGEPA